MSDTPVTPISERIRQALEGTTAGPWEWDHRDLNGGEWLSDGVIEPRVECMAYCYGGTPTLDLSTPDAALIAAAPTLLAEALAEIDRQAQVIAERDATIAELRETGSSGADLVQLLPIESET